MASKLSRQSYPHEFHCVVPVGERLLVNKSQLKEIHHVSLNVMDLERSLKFYRDVLGLEPLFQPEDVMGPGFGKAARIDGAKIRYSVLRVGDGTSLVWLIQFLTPGAKPSKQRVYDTGAPHIAFRVDDIDEVKAKLESKGVKFNSEPIRVGDGPLNGSSFVYFPDPDGVVLEIFEEPA
jgi:catechol 2,3-dioxygenase-like lactoylglutathione lyase family enzyme